MKNDRSWGLVRRGSGSASGSHVARLVLLVVTLSSLALSAPRGVVADQGAEPANIYRFVLGVDVPQSPSLVALGAAPEAILLGSAPKPLAASVHVGFGEGGEATPGLGVDIAPYYMFRGGVRRLEDYRSNTIGGRLMRVLTKTVISVGATGARDDPGSSRIGIGVRSTFHDPHDVIAPTDLPERVAEAFERSDVPLPQPEDEDVVGRGVPLARIYAEARRRVRGRSGDAQISGGWGASIEPRSRTATEDGPGDTRHLLWVSAQYTASFRYDVLASLQYRDALGRDDRLWIGAALRRKAAGADVQAGLFYDTANEQLNPGLSLDTRVSRRLGLLASVAVRPDPPAFTGPRRFQVGLSARWFLASDPWP